MVFSYDAELSLRDLIQVRLVLLTGDQVEIEPSKSVKRKHLNCVANFVLLPEWLEYPGFRNLYKMNSWIASCCVTTHMFATNAPLRNAFQHTELGLQWLYMN